VVFPRPHSSFLLPPFPESMASSLNPDPAILHSCPNPIQIALSSSLPLAQFPDLALRLLLVCDNGCHHTTPAVAATVSYHFPRRPLFPHSAHKHQSFLYGASRRSQESEVSWIRTRRRASEEARTLRGRAPSTGRRQHREQEAPRS
jgi:hypothetical protein